MDVELAQLLLKKKEAKETLMNNTSNTMGALVGSNLRQLRLDFNLVEERRRNTPVHVNERMITSGQTLTEARGVRRGVLHPKESIRVGAWNVRTMLDATKTAQVVKEMEVYKLDILGISECRWAGSSRGKTEEGGHTIIHSGEEERGYGGVALIINKKHEKALISWEGHGSRLIMARFESKHCKLTVIQCYAPTNQAEEVVKDEFYQRLESLVARAPAHDMVVVCGDLNAKVGDDRTGVEHVIGAHGIGTRNENGERLVDFCSNHNLVIGGTQFRHKDIHKLTWKSNDRHQTSNQIDHFMINRKWRGSMKDVRVYRDACVFSDHELLVSTIKLKLRVAEKCNTEGRGRQFDVERLKNRRVKEEFVVELRNRFEVLGDLEEVEDNSDDIQASWTNVKKAFCGAAVKVLGYRKREKKEWISEETWGKVKERKELKGKLNQAQVAITTERLRVQHAEKDKEVKRRAKADKKEYFEGLARQAEEAARRGENGKVYAITKELCRKRPSKAQVKDRNGSAVIGERAEADRWKEHFQQVLNLPEPDTPAAPAEIEPLVSIRTNAPSGEEVRAAILAMKSGKAAGVDSIQAEMLKADIDLSTTVLKEYFRKVWEKEEIPTDWERGIIIKLPKKGDLGNCDNWRGITLLSIPSKVLCRIILKRIDEEIDRNLREEQAGFRANRGCIDQIFSLRNIIEQCTEHNAELFINFVDFKKAFDSIHRESMWRILASYGVPKKLIDIISLFYNNFQCAVALDNNKITDWFSITSGVRQGDILSPILFLITIDWVMRQTVEGTRRGINWGLYKVLEDLDFADDLGLLSSEHKNLRKKTEKLVEIAKQVGLRINTKKTEEMIFTTREPPAPLTIDGEEIARVDKFTYLGSVISKEGAVADIRSRLGKARAAYNMLGRVWKSNQISQNLKLRLYKSNVISVLLYGSETWRVVKSEMAKLDSFNNTCLRRILKIYWPERITNELLWYRTDTIPITEEIKKRRLRWFGHVVRMDEDRTPKIALDWTPAAGRRNEGGQRTTWRGSVAKDFREINWSGRRGLSWQEAKHQAHDRRVWQTIVQRASYSPGG